MKGKVVAAPGGRGRFVEGLVESKDGMRSCVAFPIHAGDEVG